MVFSQASDAGPLLSAAYDVGLVGPGFLWFGSDAVTTDATWTNPAANMATEERRVAIMKGYFGLIPDFAGAPYNEYFARLQAQPSTVGAGPGACDTAVDDDSPATFIWQQDHDNNLSTPLECGGFDFTLPDTCVQD